MSILIRKECQPLLDAAGLDDLHVDILNKTLAIVGPCGQPVLSISGIRFDANAPKKAEISYAIELFSRFLDTHKDKILAYVTAKREFSALTPPDGSTLEGTVNTFNPPAVRYKGPNRSTGYVQVKSDNTTTVDITLSEDFTVADLNALIAKALTDSAPFFAEYAFYTEKRNQLTDMQSALTKCDI